MVQKPQDKGIEAVKEAAEKHNNIDVGTPNSGGYEMKYGGEKSRMWLLDVVEQNNVRFDNPARIDAGHRYVLILPE